MLAVARSFRFVRSIASTSYRNVSAAAQESPFEDIVRHPKVTEEDKVAMEGLNQVLINAKKYNQPLGEALKTYDGPFTLEGVSKFMREIRDVQSARAVIDWACRQPGFYYTSRLMSGILHGLDVGGQFDKAKKLIFEELKGEFKPTPAVYRSLAKHYVTADKLDAFKELVEEMQKQGIEPDDAMFIFVLEVKSRESGVKGMLQLFRDKLESGWVLDRHIAECVVHKLVDSKMWTEALEVYNMIGSRGGNIPSERCMYMLMKELCLAKKLDEAYTVTKHLLERGFEFKPPFKLVIDIFCNAGRLDEAYEVFKAGYDKFPTLKWVALVEAFCKAENPDMAMEVLDMVKPPGKEAAKYFKAVIVLLCKGDRLGDARKVMDKMLEAGISPDAQICNLLAEGYAKTLPEDDSRRKKFASNGKKAEQV